MNKLAINGGNPVRNEYLAYGRQTIDTDDIDSVVNVLKGDYLTTGPTISEFEEKVANYVGAKYSVAFSNGTAALHGACYAADIGIDDEVITTPITFAASSNCVLYMGGTPVFADIDSETYNIDPQEIKNKITSKTKAIIPVDFTGQVVDIDEIRKVIDGRNIVIIEDGAHSLGTRYKGKRVGSQADMTMFSFHPVKTITTGEGGIITTDNEEYYKKMISFRSHGITRESDELINKDVGSWYYEQQELGFNYRMTDFQAALGISQLRKLDRFIKRRKEIVDRYNEIFEELDGVILQQNAGFSDTVNHLYILKLDLSKFNVDRREIYDAIIAENIGLNVHYIPVYLHPYYKKLGYEKGLCPKAEELYNAMFTIPLFPSMSDEDVEDVINGISKVINYYRK